jgi:predicted RNase H-like HicB family nuclease
MIAFLPPIQAPSDSPSGYDVLVVSRVDEDGSLYYLASHPELEGAKAHGSTPQEALDNLADALGLYREMVEETGESLPAPHPNPATTVIEAVAIARPKSAIAVARREQPQPLVTSTSSGSLDANWESSTWVLRPSRAAG